MRLKDFMESYMDRVRRDYTVGGRVWHAKSLCYCRKKVLEQPYEDVASKYPVIIGSLLHIGVDVITGYRSEVYNKKVGGYVVKGTPDLLMDGDLVEVKFTMYPPKAPREHDELQLRIYMWLLDKDVGYLWYFSPYGIREFEVDGKLSDEDIIDLIENPRIPFWDFECKYCTVLDCDVRKL